MMSLQWVHGPRTVVKIAGGLPHFETSVLQWVHGPRTVVKYANAGQAHSRSISFNGSTVREPWLSTGSQIRDPKWMMLQWVHGPRTVVKGLGQLERLAYQHASMGPRSENRG